VIGVDFLKTKLKFEIPVYFVVGHCDYNAVYTLVEQYYKKIKAPRKQIIYFENSGHYMPFTEPAKFNDMMIKILLDEKERM
jgi:pimeloyl-ACP methyl ester carboxylesterase